VSALLATRTIRHEAATLICADLDHFKSINDQWGHPAGDAALRHVVHIWEELLRPGDLLGRLGGEEFAIFLPGTGREEGLSVAERLRARLQEHLLDWQGSPLVLTASFGVAGVGDTVSVTLEDLLRNADTALYEAKEQGRNRVVPGTALED
jgi:diguanylate cyclase (GGDEF)-like protein